MSAVLELADQAMIVTVSIAMSAVTAWVFWIYLSAMARGIAAMLRRVPAASGQVMPLANQPGAQAVFNKID
jgi:hypothetical protein